MNTQQGQLILSNQAPAKQLYIPLLLRKKTGNTHTEQDIKRISRRSLLLKRLSPFLVTALLLPVLFTYWFINEEGMLGKAFLCLKFLFAETYLVYIDVAIWKYYQGKRKVRIWLIELVCILFAAFLF